MAVLVKEESLTLYKDQNIYTAVVFTPGTVAAFGQVIVNVLSNLPHYLFFILDIYLLCNTLHILVIDCCILAISNYSNSSSNSSNNKNMVL